jgi:hypothetical protein
MNAALYSNERINRTPRSLNGRAAQVESGARPGVQVRA